MRPIRALLAFWVVLLGATAAAQDRLAIAVADAPVYVRPDAALTPLRVGQAGTRFRVLTEQDGWVQVEFNDPQWGRRVGWVRHEAVRLATAPAPAALPPGAPPALPAAQPQPTQPIPAVSTGDPATRRPPTGTGSAKLKEVKIRGYVTDVSSPTVFEIEDYRITRDQSFVLEFENDAAELRFRPEDIRIGVEVEIKGLLDEDTGELRAKQMKVDLEQFRTVEQTAVISYPPQHLQRVDTGWSGWFSVDGQRVEISPATRVLFKPTSNDKAAAKAAAKAGDASDAAAGFVPLQSVDQVTVGMVMSYEGPRARDGHIVAERVTFMRNDLEKGEASLWKTLKPEVKAFTGTKPPELKINRVGKFHLIPDEQVQSYVAAIGSALVPSYQRELPPADPSKLAFRFFVVNDNTPNAFALANGTVVVNAGLFTVLDNEAQLAAVIGHEIAHATQEHTWRQMQYHKKKRFALAFGAAIAAAYGQYSLADLLNLTQAAIQSGYSRSLENQADRVGLEYMVAAGYDPREAPRVWKNMTKAYGLQATNVFWSSHDNQATRRSYLMNELKNNHAGLDYSALRTNDEAFQEMRARLLAASDGRIRLRVTK